VESKNDSPCDPPSARPSAVYDPLFWSVNPGVRIIAPNRTCGAPSYSTPASGLIWYAVPEAFESNQDRARLVSTAIATDATPTTGSPDRMGCLTAQTPPDSR
jgi:hypothetical protein